MNPIKRLAELIEDWQFIMTHDGLKSSLLVIATEISQLPYRHIEFRIFARSLDDPLPDLHLNQQFEIRPFETIDLKFVREINRPSEARLCACRLAMGHWGLVAVNHAQVLGYAWASAEIDDHVERVKINLQPGDILFNDAFTASGCRGLGVQTALTLARLQLIKQLGYKRAICYIEKNNLPSIHVWKDKLDSSLIGSIDFKRIGGWYFSKFYEK